MNIALDIILIALLLIAFMVGYKKGFVKSVWKIAALVITIVLVMVLKTPTVNYLSGTSLATQINTKISETVTLPQGGGVNIAESLNLPKFMQSEVNDQINAEQNAQLSINDTVNSSLTSLFITIIACIGLFIIIRLILMAVFTIINGITELPIIKGVNKLVGGLLAAVNILFVIFLALALISMFAPADSELFDAINNTYLVKYFYNYNILLQLFMKL